MDLLSKSLEELATADFVCSCGQRHRTDIKHICIESGAIEKLVPLVKQEILPNKPQILVVLDVNTKRVAGDSVLALLNKAGFEISECFFDDTELIASEETINTIRSRLDEKTGLLIAVGSGTINDVTKYVSYQTHIPYFVVATAPSMDGYSSTVAPLVFNGFKYAYEAIGPIAIIGDTDILKDAPMPMMAAGLGDLIGKYTSICDWRISHLLNGEYYCDEVAKLILHSVKLCTDNIDGLSRREPLAVKNVMESLALAGIAMSYVGNSRPASSSEHHIAHYWEVMLLLDGKKAVLHGTKVGIATTMVCDLYKKLSTYEPDLEKSKAHIEQFSKAAWTQKIKELYRTGAPDVLRMEEEYGKNDKAKALERVEKTIELWPQIKALFEVVPNSSFVEDALKRVGGETNPLNLGLTIEDIYNSIVYSKEMRFRYAILQTLWDFGILEESGHELCERFM